MSDDLSEAFAGVAAASPGPGKFNDLIEAYALARANRERLDDETKAAREKEAAAEAALFDRMEQQNLRSVRHEQYGLFILNDLAWADVRDRAKAREWAENEMPELLLLNSSQLSTVVRAALRGERDMPPGVEAKFSRKINWRRG